MLRFYILNATGAATLAALSFAGVLAPILDGPARWGAAGLTVALLVALAAMPLSRSALTAWIAHKMTLFGLIGTVIGLQDAVLQTAWDGETTAMLGQVASGLGLALFSTLIGLVYYVWLDLNLRLFAPARADDGVA